MRRHKWWLSILGGTLSVVLLSATISSCATGPSTNNNNPQLPANPLPPINNTPISPPNTDAPITPPEGNEPPVNPTGKFRAFYDDPSTDPYQELTGLLNPYPEDQVYTLDQYWQPVYHFENDYRIGSSALTNDVYKYISTRSVRLEVGNWVGTGWWMDYLKTNDGSYPLTWYISTNIHVIAPLVNKQDNYGERNYLDSDVQTETFKIGWINDIDRDAVLEPLTVLPKTIFAASDFMGKTAKELYGSSYLSQNNLSDLADTKLTLDYAVIEVVFDSVEQAKRITKNIAQNQNEKLVNFQTSTYYENHSRYELEQVNDLHIGGFPLENGHKFTVNQLNKATKPGTTFARRVGREMLNYRKRALHGMIDQTAQIDFILEFDHQIYKRVGIAYEYEMSDLQGGVSGSMSTNGQSEIVGIMWGSLISQAWLQPRIALVDPLIMRNGYVDSNGYEVPLKYDLIYGMTGQAKSFKSQMQKFHAGKTSNLLGQL